MDGWACRCVFPQPVVHGGASAGQADSVQPNGEVQPTVICGGFFSVCRMTQ